MNIQIRRLSSADTGIFLPLRVEALLAEPFSFGSSPESDRGGDPDFVAQLLASPDQAIIGAFVADALLGSVGIYRDKSPKGAHRAHIWGMYVRKSVRRQGAGRRLMRAALQFARQLSGVRQVQLSVSDRAPEAAALYRSLGFEVWGVEPAALCVDGQFAAEEHMVLVFEG